ncbi:lysine histidine transporter 1-like isoform X2 [Arachis stenosperma]|nr:lysine histidine transporter 1-like isoform X2 [Arachis stenosperma]XP_057731040.1 lysine histidine transporter 1-like isoform X2 [Arachis stenosperma]XP_057731041.1 lysine histidine transporter 1-like isoform X2 [Arachis stenosperma]XP_057731042.1 lysine histidine transporter 1-like isoform X2 [Arachis stenosperma]XP_057731043.1 lysine histidine transporter 1-like isoform X2 [Arachis stenosperma]
MEDNNKDINNWLAVTRSRNGKWWYSAFHNVTALVGAGVLGFPYAMSQLGWGPGITVLVLSWICTLYTAWQMIEMHEAESGKRFDRYHELGQYAFGEKLGLWIVVPQTLIVDVGTDIIYMITGGNSLKKAHQILCKDCKPIRTTYFIMIFASLQFFLSHLPSFNSIIGVSISASVMSICYSTIAWTSSAHKGALPDVKYDGRSSTTTGNVFDFFTGLGTIAFGYAAHNVLLEIQATVPSTPEKPSKKAMWKGMIAAYIVVGLCYFPVAIFGYWAFGNSVTDNILMSLDKPHWLTAVANIFVVIHVTGSYQVFAVPVFDMMESVMVRRMNFRPTWYLRFISRNIYVALTMLVAIIFPFFGGLLSFLGGLVFAPTTYFLPCIIWLVVYKPKRFSGSWCANWFCIVFGVLLMVLGSIGAMREIILQAKDYKFFS